MRHTTLRVALALGLWGIAGAVAAGPAVAGTTVRTTTTTYTYNADGAPTAITKQVDNAGPTTTYLTWDNCVPDATDPASCASMPAGNGNLLGDGPAPGSGQFEDAFTFDGRNRLVTYAGKGKAAQYEYHPDGLLEQSSTQDGDGLRFYYDQGVTNIRQESKDLWSARLGPVRYLNDGTEEVLLAPRKDNAAVYVPGQSTLSAYRYKDAYGAEGSGALASHYDLRENSFRYAGEYRDALWGGIYLRTRWYHPELPTFLSRDPELQYDRYGYGAANPVMKTDPTGRSASNKTADKLLNQGVSGHVFRTLFPLVVDLEQLFVHPHKFWRGVKQNRHGMDIFLAAGVAAEVGLYLVEGYGGLGTLWWREQSLNVRYGSRLLLDLGLDAGQAVAIGASKGLSKFNVNAFVQSLETVPVWFFMNHYFLGQGYRPYTLRGEDVAKRATALEGGSALILAGQTPVRIGGIATTWTSPFLEQQKIGLYHETAVRASREYIAFNELTTTNIATKAYSSRAIGVFGGGPERVTEILEAQQQARFRVAGTSVRRSTDFEAANPLDLRNDVSVKNMKKLKTAITMRSDDVYDPFGNNCHVHSELTTEQALTPVPDSDSADSSLGIGDTSPIL